MNTSILLIVLLSTMLQTQKVGRQTISRVCFTSAGTAAETVSPEETCEADPVTSDTDQVVPEKSEFTLIPTLLSRADIVSYRMPKFPRRFRRKGLSGMTMTINFAVDSKGKVLPDITVLEGTGYSRLDRATKRKLSKWRFVPVEGIERREGIITFSFLLL